MALSDLSARRSKYECIHFDWLELGLVSALIGHVAALDCDSLRVVLAGWSLFGRGQAPGESSVVPSKSRC